MDAAQKQKETGGRSDLMNRLRADSAFAGVISERGGEIQDPLLYTGCSSRQVDSFLNEIVYPIIMQRKDLLNEEAEEVKV